MRLIARYLGFFAPYVKRVVFLSALILLGTGIAVVIPQIPRYAIDHVIPAGDASKLILLGAGAITFIAVFTVIDYWLLLYSYLLTQDVILDIRVSVFAHLQRLHLSFFETTISGTILSRVINDVNQLQEMTQAGISRLGRMLATLIAVFTMMVLLDWKLALVVLAIIPIMGFIIFRQGAKLRAAALKSSRQMAEMTGYISEQLQGVSVVKAFTAEPMEYERFTTESAHYRDLQNHQRREMGMIQSTVEFSSTLGTILVVCVGGYIVIGSRMTVGDLTAFIMYTASIFDPVRQLVMFYGILQRGMASVERIFELIDTEDEVPEPAQPIPLPPGGGKVEFKDVGFRYRKEGDYVLSGVSFTIAPGTMTALVGVSGSGKTTIAKLVPRFYDPLAGEVRIDGANVRNVRIAELRREIGMVLQESFLFSGSIRDNIAYGKPHATEDEIVTAAVMANAHEFIVTLPNGYGAEIGERGVKLSGGQKQRIAIARAIIRNPRILILDEATSNLDSESERLIHASIDRILVGRTTLVIAHRLSTVMRADLILVIENGRVIESGRHGELLAGDGKYRQLYELQFKDEHAYAAK